MIEKVINVDDMSSEEKQRFTKMVGNIMLWLEEGLSVKEIADKLNLKPWQVRYNIREIKDVLRKNTGLGKGLKKIFTKQ